jgi:hypothetical protein
MHDNLWKALFRDAWLVLLMLAIGNVLIVISTPIAQWVGEPAFAPWGLFFGGSFLVGALTHIIRWLLFQPLSMQKTAVEAVKSPVGAGFVFLGICIVLSAFVLVMGGTLRL